MKNESGPPPLAQSETKRSRTPAAERALAEAAERRRLMTETGVRPKEIAGRGGAEPVRYGDWEVRGLATDF